MHVLQYAIDLNAKLSKIINFKGAGAIFNSPQLVTNPE